MTDPTTDGAGTATQEIPDLIGSGAQALIENANRLGLLWKLSLATVNNTDPLVATLDGDSVAIGVVSMVGDIFLPDERVYVVSVPPSGNFVIGRTTIPYANNTLNANVSTVGIAASSAGSEAAISTANWVANAATNEPLYSFNPKGIFAVHVQGLFIADVVTDTFNIRVRVGQATTTGTLLGAVQYIAAGGANGQSFDFTKYFKNTRDAIATTKMSLSIQRVAGSGTVSLFGSTGFPLIMNFSQVGTIATLPQLANGCPVLA